MEAEMPFEKRRTVYPQGKVPLFCYIPTELSALIGAQSRKAGASKQQFVVEATELYALIYQLPPAMRQIVATLVRGLRRAAGLDCSD